MISKEALEKYKAIYWRQFKKDISDQEALEQATRLLNLMRLIYQTSAEKI